MGGGGIDERMDYAMMEDMKEEFTKAAQTIADTLGEMQQIAGMMEDGALVGKAGDAFVQALRVDLKGSLDELHDKLHELANDINSAVAYKREGVESARNRFA